jgi:integrase
MKTKTTYPATGEIPGGLEQDALTAPVLAGGALTTQTILERAGQAANRAASRHVFAEYRQRRAQNTVKRQDAELRLFASYLLDVARIETGDLSSDPSAWKGVTWGLITGFMKWLLDVRGYSIGTVNVALSTVKVYAGLAARAGELESDAYTLIKTVSGYRHAEGINLDTARVANGQATRRTIRAGVLTKEGEPVRAGKKASPVTLTDEQAKMLKTEHASDGQGRRDRLLMCLAIDWGLRCSELHALTVENLQVDSLCASLRVYRRKTKSWSTLDLTSTPDTLSAARAYLDGLGGPTAGALLVGSTRRGQLTDKAMSIRAISKRVTHLGRKVGIEGLSPHDLRHYAATAYGKWKSTKQLMEIFGWTSPAMAVRYQESPKKVRI